MKLKVVIDLDDEWVGGDNDVSLSEAIEKSITTSVVRTVREATEQQVKDKIETEVMRQVQQLVQKQISGIVEQSLSVDHIRKDQWSGKMVTAKEFVTSAINNALDKYSDKYSSTLEGVVREQAKKTADEFKERYDILFATSIVSRLSENNMLREDIASLLLTNKPEITRD